MRSLLFGAICILCPTLFAQCPPIDFINVRELVLHDRFTATPLVRQPDGTYTAYPHERFAPYRRRPGIPRFEERLMACLPVTTGNAAPSIFGRPLGAGSTGVLAIPDTGAQTPVGVWKVFGGNNLGVWQANPDYTFKAQANYSIGRLRGGILHGDFNGDQREDLLVIGAPELTQSSPGTVFFLRGRGDGTFDNPVPSVTGASFPSSAAISDFNGDGRLDLVVSHGGDPGSLRLLTGNGDGTFSQAGTLFTGFGGPVAVADVNGDNRPDVITTVFASGVYSVTVFAGTGGAAFQRVEPSVPLATSARYLTTGDFNRDGRQDLAVTGKSTVQVLLGAGNGTFGPPAGYVVGVDPYTLVVADVNRDAIPDLVVGDGLPGVLTLGEESGTMSVLFGRGDGSFVGAPIYLAGNTARAMAGADFNGDGRLDFALTGFGSAVAILTARANGTYAASNSPTGSVFAESVAAGDLNGDGRADLLLGGSNGVWQMIGGGNGTFQAPTRIATTASEVKGLTVADLNGDGRPEVAAVFAGSSASNPSGLLILTNQGSSFQAGAPIRAGSVPSAVAAADLNGDGRTDLVVVDYGTFDSSTDPGGVLVFLSQATGEFGTPQTLAAGRNPRTVSIGDVNGDRLPDLAVPTTGPNFGFFVGLIRQSSPGVFRPVNLMNTDFGPSDVAIADFDGDSKADLVIAHCCGDTDMTYMVGNGDGTFQPEVHFPGGPDPSRLVVAELNGDTKPDLVILNSGTAGAGVSVFINNSPASPFAVANSAGFARGSIAPASLASAFGSRLATGAGQPEGVELPTTLAGTIVRIRDSAGTERLAPLVAVFPTQVNFLVPADVAIGRGTVTISAGDGLAQTADVYFAPVAPGVFLLNGAGLAAAQIVRVAGGTQTAEDVYQVEGNAVVPKPISFGPATNQLVLTLYMSGLRGRSDPANVRVNIRNQDLPVLYAGEQPQFPGLDQINVTLPRNLAGGGLVDLVVTVDNQVSNVTKLLFQ